MGKKRVIEQRINKHTKELEESIISIEPKLIEAFVRVYGEKHRAKITSTILNMSYIFFISREFNNYIKSSFRNFRKKDLAIVKSYLKYLNKQDNRFNTVAPDDEDKFIVKNYLSRYPYKAEDYCAFKDSLEDDYPCCSAALYIVGNDYFASQYICLPIFTIDLKTIIHELNHALNITILGYTDDLLLMRTQFKKESSEELVNDFIAELVYETYLEIGGVIPKPLKRFKIGNEYEYKDYIVAHLFVKLIDIILESRISENFNLFYELVGKDKTEELENIMSELYTKNYFDADLYHKLVNLIDEIYEKVINTEPHNIEEKIAKLERQGYIVRRLKRKGE